MAGDAGTAEVAGRGLGVPSAIDAIVLGMGPGGEDLAARLADGGMTVVGVEANLVGGECPYWGCIPSKMMVRASGLLAEARRIRGTAGEAVLDPDWGPVARRIAEATDHWDDTAAVERFESKGGHFVRGWGVVEGPRRVRVGDTVLEAGAALVIATGSSPSVPPVPGLAGTSYWTNREAVECDDLPQSLAVLGGGAVGMELGQVFARFGVEVHLLEASERILAMEEPESSSVVREALAADGISVRTGVQVTGVDERDARFVLQVTGEGDDALVTERLLVATGRHANLAAIGAGSLGVDVHTRGLPIDGHCRVAPGVWAIGDVTGIGAFTHLSVYQARIAADAILGRASEEASYHALPRVTFTDPEVGAVGMTESAARDAGLPVAVALAELPSSARGWIHGPGNAGFVKLVVDASRGVLVGATAAGPSGGEVLGLLTLAVHARVPVPELHRMIYAYPTFHRAVLDALDRLAA